MRRGGWISTSRSTLHAGGKDFIGWLDGLTGEAGINDTVVRSDLETVHHPYPDLHNPPAVIARPDGRLVTFLVGHGDPTIKVRVSTNAYDETAWGAEYVVASTTGGFTYPFPFYLDGTLYLFIRDEAASSWTPTRWALLASTDGGTTFTSSVLIDNTPGRSAYPVVSSDGTRADFAMSNSPYHQHDSALWHFYMEGGAFYRSDGTAIGSPPFAEPDMTLVYSGESAWVEDIHGHRIAFTLNPDGTAVDQRHMIAEYDGSWSTRRIAHQGDGFFLTAGPSGPIPTGSGGACIDDEAYYHSKQTGPRSLGIYRHDLATGTDTYLGPGMFPQTVLGSPVPVRWLVGVYRDFNDYRLDIAEPTSVGLQGPVGPQGPVGATGPQGPQGEPGVCDCCPSPPAVIGSLPFPLPE